MKLKFIAAGIMAAASFNAMAVDHTLGLLDPADPDTLSGFSTKFANSGTSIDDTWFFELLAPSSASFGAWQTFSAPIGAITGFTGVLIGHGNLDLSSTASSQSLSWVGDLAAGSYAVHITGVTATKNVQYTASVSALPVPEPETYGMMLAGLALVGAAARRRAKKSA
ncbi:FxDxF family PEP-CTERM protein [Janthinobacterium sp.]|uniref:FxDxF family PEP-CTERM protein n=1 Tax=Janthinobacterium sp. TaxID=1871054 RepID=UPI002899D29C|nr:FxDxF family PEP-CTERM protein [Janthinobacterium sp.]